MNIIDRGDYELIKRPRRLAQHTLEIFAVDAEGSGGYAIKELLKQISTEAKPKADKFTKRMMKKSFGRDSCFKESHSHRSCREAVWSCVGAVFRSSAKKIGSVESINKGSKGEVSEIRAKPIWERVRFQIDSEAVGTADPKEIAKAFEMKASATSKRGVGYVQSPSASSPSTCRIHVPQLHAPCLPV